MARPLISLVIPTRERCETLKYALASVLENTTTNCEVIVSDNYSEDRTAEVVRALADPRVRYLNTGRRLPMCENWEFAFDHVAGDFVVYIGDDDAVIPRGIDLLERTICAEAHQVYCWPKHVYVWPFPGQAAYVEFAAKRGAPRTIDIRALARRVVSRGGWGHYYLPNMYHSAVAVEIPRAIRRDTGRVFHSMQPDVFLSMAIPVYCHHAFHLGQSVTFHGRSERSNGGTVIRNRRSDALHQFINEYGAYRLHPTLYPRIDRRLNLSPDSILVAMDLFPGFYADQEFNYSAMWSMLCTEARAFGAELSVSTVVRKRGDIREFHALNLLRFFTFYCLSIFARARRRLMGPVGKSKEFRAKGPVPANVADFAKTLA